MHSEWQESRTTSTTTRMRKTHANLRNPYAKLAVHIASVQHPLFNIYPTNGILIDPICLFSLSSSFRCIKIMHVYFGFTTQSFASAVVATLRKWDSKKAIMDSTVRIDMLCLCAFLLQCVFNRLRFWTRSFSRHIPLSFPFAICVPKLSRKKTFYILVHFTKTGNSFPLRKCIL